MGHLAIVATSLPSLKVSGDLTLTEQQAINYLNQANYASNQVIMSLDDIAFSAETSAGLPTTWWGLGYSNTLDAFCAVADVYAGGSSNYVMTSPDGINWTRQNLPVDVGFRRVCWDSTHNHWVAIGKYRAGYSADGGVTWVSNVAPGGNNSVTQAVVHSPTLGITVAISSTANTAPDEAYWSDDGGATWNLATTMPSATKYSYNDCIWVGGGHNYFLAISSDNIGSELMYSIDGKNWQYLLPGLIPSSQWRGLAYNEDDDVILAISNQASGAAGRTMIAQASLGSVWGVNNPGSPFIDTNWEKVCWDRNNRNYVAVANSLGGGTTTIATSPDGRVWTMRNRPTTAAYQQIVYGGGNNKRVVGLASNQTTGTFAGTLPNAPHAGAPDFWVPMRVNGLAGYFPLWYGS